MRLEITFDKAQLLLVQSFIIILIIIIENIHLFGQHCYQWRWLAKWTIGFEFVQPATPTGNGFARPPSAMRLILNMVT